MIVLSVINQKGGVGKTTTAQALSFGLANLKKKVLLIDLDSQMNLSFAVDSDLKKVNIFDVLMNNIPISESIQTLNDIHFIPASIHLANINLTVTGKLKEALHQVKSFYNYVVLDTPPQLNIITINALTASDETIITSQADIFSIQGISQLNSTILSVKKHSNPSLTIKGILITRYNSRTILTKDMIEILKNVSKKLNTIIFNSKIRECTAVKEAQAKQQDIFTYSVKCNASKDYKNFINEYIKRSI